MSDVSAYSDDVPSDAEMEGEPDQNQQPNRRRNDPGEWEPCEILTDKRDEMGIKTRRSGLKRKL